MIRNADDHQRQSEHNKSASDALAHLPEMIDWRVTMTFYAALHAVRACFSASGITVPSSHVGMKQQIAEHVPEIREPYEELYRLSLRSRYTYGAEVTEDDEKTARMLYEEVADAIRQRMSRLEG